MCATGQQEPPVLEAGACSPILWEAGRCIGIAHVPEHFSTGTYLEYRQGLRAWLDARGEQKKAAVRTLVHIGRPANAKRNRPYTVQLPVKPASERQELPPILHVKLEWVPPDGKEAPVSGFQNIQVPPLLDRGFAQPATPLVESCQRERWRSLKAKRSRTGGNENPLIPCHPHRTNVAIDRKDLFPDFVPVAVGPGHEE